MSYCTQHPGKDAVGACCECGHLVCKACYTELNDKVYCASCANKLFTLRQQEAPTIVTPPPPAAPQKPSQAVQPEPARPAQPVKQAIPEPPKPSEPVKQAAPAVQPKQDVLIVPPPPAAPQKQPVAAAAPITRDVASPEIKYTVAPAAAEKKPPRPTYSGANNLGFLWWLAPVLLAFIGGLLAWFIVKDKEPGRAKAMLWTGIGLTVIYAVAIVVVAVLPGISASQSSKGTILYSSDGDKTWQVWGVDASGDGAGQFTKSDNVSKYFNTQGVWSPAAKKMVFYSSRDGNFEIYKMEADGSNQTNLTNHNFMDYQPDWSADGKKIAFVSNRDGNDEIYVINPEGGDIKRLTNSKPADGKPRWSPGSDKLLFGTERDGNWEIYVMDADGSNQRRLTTNDAWEGHARWSPDARSIVFSSNRDGNAEIYTMDADGNNQKRVTFNSANDYTPCFSPDGARIVYYSNIDKNDELYIMNRDGGNQVRLTRTKVANQAPQWISEQLKAPSELQVPPLKARIIGSNISTANKGASSEDTLHYVKYVAEQDGIIDLIKVYSTKAGNVKAAVYSHNNKDDLPLEKLSVNEQPVPCAINQWNNIYIPPVPVIKGMSYWLAFNSDATGMVMNGGGQQRTLFIKGSKFEDFTFPANPPAGMTAVKNNMSISGWSFGEGQLDDDDKSADEDK